MNHQFSGNHLLVEFYGVRIEQHDQDKLHKCLETCCKQAKVTMLKFDYVKFENGGYTAFALLAESHISIHTYPEYKSIFLDVFTCGKSDTGCIVDALAEYYRPQKQFVQCIERGEQMNKLPLKGKVS